MCRHIGLLLGKRLDTILLRHRIRKYPDSASTRYRIRCGFIFSTLESRFKNIRIGCRIRWMRVDGSRIRKEKVADSKIPIPYSQFLRLRRLCSDDDDFLVKSRDMTTFFTQRGYPCTSLEHDLRRVTTIRRPDALSGSERGERAVDRVPVVLTYHPFNTQIKRYLIQNFCILSMDLQTCDIFPRAPFVAHKCDLSLRNMLVRSTNNSSTEQPGSCACQRSRCNTCEYINPLTMIPGPKCTLPFENILHVCRKISCIAYPATDALISTSVKPGKALEVDLVSICEAYARTLLNFLWPNLSTLRAKVSQMSRCMVRVCVVAPTSSENNRR